MDISSLNTKSNEKLDLSVRIVSGVGDERARLLGKLGIRTLRDLIGFFPRAYEDRTVFKEISELTPGVTVCVRAIAATSPELSHIRGGLDLVKLRVADDTGVMDIVFFNQKYMKNAIRQGEEYIFYGKTAGTVLRPAMTNPIFEKAAVSMKPGSKEASSGERMGRIVPVYSLTSGLSQNVLRAAVRRGLDECGGVIQGVLSDRVEEKYGLCKADFAYENIHFPSDEDSLKAARGRLIFEELFVLSAAMKQLRARRAVTAGTSISPQDFHEFTDRLPFTPTNAQMNAIKEASLDMSQKKPMNRLIQGDVGSGKTLIAAACCWMAWRSGFQSAFMAPTEILAKQHFQTLSGLLEPLGIRVGLLTGSMSAKQKLETRDKLKKGEIDLITGTHALISEGVDFLNLAFVVADEQHRFGVNQRSRLTGKGDSPHVLVMSATPIPRTLALIIYGDLDVSLIDEMPPGRQDTETFVVTEKHRERINAFIKRLVGEGRQVFIICPAVEEDEESDNGIKSARAYYEQLRKQTFPELRVALVHGKMPAAEKDAAMTAFTAGESDILVATTVVEVGVDVANAALIVIENADRFGLSQLHQLRGRVGRGEHKSYCILFEESSGDASHTRLAVMRETNDGFKIAEEDLKQRGPGDFFGARQHGLPELRIANFAEDMLVLNQAQNAAEEVIRGDSQLVLPENRRLAEQVARLFEINTDRLN